MNSPYSTRTTIINFLQFLSSGTLSALKMFLMALSQTLKHISIGKSFFRQSLFACEHISRDLVGTLHFSCHAFQTFRFLQLFCSGNMGWICGYSYIYISCVKGTCIEFFEHICIIENRWWKIHLKRILFLGNKVNE